MVTDNCLFDRIVWNNRRIKKNDQTTTNIINISAMTRRNSPRDIQALDDLNALDRIVVDKRQQQRASAKKNRRNRHYEKQFIRNALTQRLD
jgi:hypothetical protein